MARKNKQGDYSYTRTACLRDREHEGRFAVIQIDAQHSRVVRRRADGSAEGDGELVRTADLIDLKSTHIVPMGQRGTLTPPGEVRRALGIEEGMMVEIIQEEDHFRVRPLKPLPRSVKAADLDDLVSRITPENTHAEVSFGGPVGREIW
jgi:antitoxin component of MazEF toxin-antitoxin module